MAAVFESRRRGANRIPRDPRRAVPAAVLAMASGIVLLSLPDNHLQMWVNWAASSVALAGGLTLILAGERAWDQMLVNARAAGVVAPY